MKSPIPPPLPTKAYDDRARPSDSFQNAIFDLIIAYDGAASVAEMRSVLEEVLLLYYDHHGDGTAGSA